jgi:hypothetical protein
VAIIVLLILSALTSGSLVIQRQLKALRRLGPSCPPGLHAGPNLSVFFIFLVIFMGTCTFSFFVVPGIYSPKVVDDEALVQIVIYYIVALSFIVAGFCLVVLTMWFLRYFRYFALSWLSRLYRELPEFN